MSTTFVPLKYLGVCIASMALLAVDPPTVKAACTLAVTAGDDQNTCDSASAPGFTDLDGNNSLTFPAAGNGVITGNILYGAGNDLVQMDADTARINGALNQGDGANIFRLNLGTVTGSVTQGAGMDVVQISGGQAGAISQGAGIDSFSMSGGTIASLAQGDGLDTFNMSGGTITGAFEDGDQAVMTGGTIGRVDMKLDNNLFDMRGGRIINNLVTGFGNDTILISGTSTIGGNISTSGGTDIVEVRGGVINGQILTSFGDDHFTWDTAGEIHAFILMGADNDTALLKNLTDTQLSTTPLLDGGVGNDTLTFDNTQASTPGRYANWETVRLDNGSRLTLGGTFVLGDTGSGTGTLAIDGSSALRVDTGVISPFTAGQLTTVNNSGLIDMTTASTRATDSLTINGNYTGNNASLALQSILGADGSPSDKLVVSQGVMQGTTAISITNLGGAGGLTVQDGIQVVQATQGATSSAGAFSLRGTVSASAFDYYLFKGGVAPGTEQNWYLRSTVPVAPLPTPEAPVVPLPEPAPDTPTLPPPGPEPIVIYRPEVPVYSVLFPAAQQMVQAMLGTYHTRLGDQSQQRSSGALPAGWGRVYGASTRQSYAGTVNPRLDSTLSGFQVGSDLYAWTDEAGLTQRVGFFVGHGRLKGNVDGFNGGFEHRDAGKTTLRGDSLGVYWTLIGAQRGYIDLVLMGTRFDGTSESDRGVKLKTRGHDVLGSVEAGLPLRVSEAWELEPQAQVIVNRTRFDSQHDGLSKVAFDADTQVTTRLGVRLRGNYWVSGLPLQPYVRVNVWHAASGTQRVIFNDVTDIDTEQKSTTLDLNVGATLEVAEGVSLYGQVGYNRNLDSQSLDGRAGTLGVRIAF
ncbi:autotransporter family protein [Pseudomonas sp. SDO528_S397]